MTMMTTEGTWSKDKEEKEEQEMQKAEKKQHVEEYRHRNTTTKWN